MFKFLRSLVGPRAEPPPANDVRMAGAGALVPQEVTVAGLAPFPIARHRIDHYGLPLVDWPAVSDWLGGSEDDAVRAAAWTACERAWLLGMREALGPQYRLAESARSALVSSLDEHLSRTTLAFMGRTLDRVVHLLAGIAQSQPWGRDILIVFDDEERYYEYVSRHHPGEGELALSSGMYIGEGCGHFVTVKADLRAIEPIIAHEMTHGCLAHLPLPLWLNEGIAVNTEARLVSVCRGPGASAEMRAKHHAFWGEDEVQQFWSGASFRRTDDGNALSYDLARLMVEHMARDWDRFRPFVLAASYEDAGAAAAAAHLGMDLGSFVAALLEEGEPADWSPRPQSWTRPAGLLPARRGEAWSGAGAGRTR
jgi:hypothetical protein